MPGRRGGGSADRHAAVLVLDAGGRDGDELPLCVLYEDEATHHGPALAVAQLQGDRVREGGEETGLQEGADCARAAPSATSYNINPLQGRTAKYFMFSLAAPAVRLPAGLVGGLQERTEWPQHARACRGGGAFTSMRQHAKAYLEEDL